MNFERERLWFEEDQCPYVEKSVPSRYQQFRYPQC
jgi:hypothetical protein